MLTPVPAGWRIRRAAGTRVMRGGEVLVGGSPLRILTLSPHAGLLVRGWLAGQPVGESGAAEVAVAEVGAEVGAAEVGTAEVAAAEVAVAEVGAADREGAEARAERLLARRLLDAGLADPDPPARPHGAGALTIIVPVYADPERLSACLAPIAGRWPTVVVDDGSPDPAPIVAVAEQYGARYVRHGENRGPSAARNRGLAMAETPLVAFLDADCVPPADFPGRLLDHLEDPAVVLAAPRIVTAALASGPIAAYERCRSALDMGPRASLVRPYSPVWYVPSAAMVARRDALGTGFDEDLSLGEDVDLVWRLHDAGWQLRYDPWTTVAHEDRVRPMAWYRRRVAYNESVAPLLRRHPERVPVVFLSPAAALAWAATLAGLPPAVIILAAARATRLRRTVGARLPAAGRWALRLSADVTLREGRELARALAGPWAPFTLVALALTRGPRRRNLAIRLGGLLLAMTLFDWLADRPPLDPGTYAALRLADESSRGAGIWLGCLRTRDFRALLPRRPPPPSRR